MVLSALAGCSVAVPLHSPETETRPETYPPDEFSPISLLLSVVMFANDSSLTSNNNLLPGFISRDSTLRIETRYATRNAVGREMRGIDLKERCKFMQYLCYTFIRGEIQATYSSFS